MSTILKWPPTHLQGQIFNGPISKSAYYVRISLHIYQILCFYHKVHNFLVCHPTIVGCPVFNLFHRFPWLWVSTSNRLSLLCTLSSAKLLKLIIHCHKLIVKCRLSLFVVNYINFLYIKW